jgi:hypothetical protein
MAGSRKKAPPKAKPVKKEETEDDTQEIVSILESRPAKKKREFLVQYPNDREATDEKYCQYIYNTWN